MKLPSVSAILKNAAGTYFRFPAAILTAVIGTIAAVVLESRSWETSAQWLLGVCYASSLGIPLLMTSVLVAERRGWNRGLTQVAGLLLLAAYWFTLPSNIMGGPLAVSYRFAILLAAVHLLASFAPFAGERESAPFWNYNKTLFLRFLVALLFTHVLWGGLSIALAALHELFALDIPGDRYAQLWMVLVGVFNTWFFLGGIPERGGAENEALPYPKGLKVFCQYVLLPLVAIYLIILYAYAIKILLAWSWPEGWVSKLILGFSITGILALLLVHPLREIPWIRLIWKWYFIILAPLVVLLLLATFRRISDYGITENRYVGIVLACWLAVMTLYFIVSRAKSIKAIPISLCALGIGIAWGPWGAFRISEASQLGRLATALGEAGILVDGKVQKRVSRLPAKEVENIRSAVRYLVETHGTESLQPWFTQRLDTLGATIWGPMLAHQRSALIVSLMGIEGSGGIMREWEYTSQTTSGSVEGYVYLAEAGKSTVYDIAGHGKVSVEPWPDSLSIIVRALEPDPERVDIDLRPICQRLGNQTPRAPATPEEMTVEAVGKRLKVKAILRRLHCPGENETPGTMSIDGVVLIGFLQQ